MRRQNGFTVKQMFQEGAEEDKDAEDMMVCM